jgi:hypothetical protein
MLAKLASWCVAIVFMSLSGLHVFWAFGGKWGVAATVPEVAGRVAFSSSRGATLTVSGALLLAGFIVALQGGILNPPPFPWLLRAASFVLGSVFVVRAIGDFRLAGFFKTVKGTAFAHYDTVLYSPLCLAIGAIVLWLTFR